MRSRALGPQLTACFTSAPIFASTAVVISFSAKEVVTPALVAERLGHDLNTLLRTYAHVIRQDDESVRAMVDGVLGGSAEDWLRTEVV